VKRLVGAWFVVAAVACAPADQPAEQPDGGDVTTGDLCGVALAAAAAEDLATTPRADGNLELLAIRLSPGLTAQESEYERIVRDVAQIRSMEPRLSEVRHRARWDGQSLLLSVDRATYDAVDSGDYHAWDCLNTTLGVLESSHERLEMFDMSLVTLKLEGTYNIDVVLGLYKALHGVIEADIGIVPAGGRTICVTDEDGTYQYAFDDGHVEDDGECLWPEYCLEHIFDWFSTTPDGTVSKQSSWTLDMLAAPAPTWPEWASRYGLCSDPIAP